ncbi:hypothetical protein R6Q59_002699 [Mikania micrantha]
MSETDKPCVEKLAEGSKHIGRHALIKAREENERSKLENKALKMLADIGAWENSKRA